MRLSELLAVPRGIIAAVGGGGKTTLLTRLALELSQTHTVLLAATTHMWPPRCDTLLSPTREAIAEAFTKTRLLAVGDPTAEGKLTEVSALNGDYTGLADYVLVEADGSRGLPLKAPDGHEPVLPEGAALVIAVAGMSCVGRTIETVAHRPARYARLVGAEPGDVVTPAMVAYVLTHPKGQKKGVSCRFEIALNQADTEKRVAFARDIAKETNGEAILLALAATPPWVERWQNGRPIKE